MSEMFCCLKYLSKLTTHNPLIAGLSDFGGVVFLLEIEQCLWEWNRVTKDCEGECCLICCSTSFTFSDFKNIRNEKHSFQDVMAWND